MGRKFKDKNKLSNYQKLFSFALGSCVCFQNFRVHMENAIEIFQTIAKEMKVKKSEHRQKQEEEANLLRKKEAKDELKRTQHTKMLNIQLLVVRSSLHSPSFSKCEESKVYNEKM